MAAIFVKLSNGARLRADTITAIRPLEEGHGLPPRVLVDYVVAGTYWCIELTAKSPGDRDAMADEIMREIYSALSCDAPLKLVRAAIDAEKDQKTVDS